MHLIYKQLRLYINLYIKKHTLFLLRNDGLFHLYFSNQIEFNFQIEEFISFFRSLNKHSIQYFEKVDTICEFRFSI